MKRKLLSSFLWLFLGGCVSVVPVSLPATAYAQSGVAAIVTYYSDATHTTVVGTKTIHCDCTITMTGTETAFHTTRIGECAPM